MEFENCISAFDTYVKPLCLIAIQQFAYVCYILTQLFCHKRSIVYLQMYIWSIGKIVMRVACEQHWGFLNLTFDGFRTFTMSADVYL